MADASTMTDAGSFSKVRRNCSPEKGPKFQISNSTSESSSAAVLREDLPTSLLITSIEEGLMSSNGVQTMSASSSTPQTSGDSQTHSSTLGKQPARRRKTYHGT